MFSKKKKKKIDFIFYSTNIASLDFTLLNLRRVQEFVIEEVT